MTAGTVDRTVLLSWLWAVRCHDNTTADRLGRRTNGNTAAVATTRRAAAHGAARDSLARSRRPQIRHAPPTRQTLIFTFTPAVGDVQATVRPTATEARTAD